VLRDALRAFVRVAVVCRGMEGFGIFFGSLTTSGGRVSCPCAGGVPPSCAYDIAAMPIVSASNEMSDVVDMRPKRRNERDIDAPKKFPPDIPRDASDNREKPGCVGYSKK
jgi:hypothetical protein